MNEQNIITNQATNVLLLAIAERLKNIEARLEKKVAYLSTEEAIGAYKRHLDEGINKKGRRFSQDSVQNWSWLLLKLQEHFEANTNIAEITKDEWKEFLNKYWSDSNAGTFRQRIAQLRVLINFCIEYLEDKGNPTFTNPIKRFAIEHHPEQPEWIPIETMIKFINSAKKEHHWLAFTIMATSGIRINDLMNLRRCDIEGRILHLRMHDNYRPKSGKKEEIAVIPQIVADRLAQYIEDLENMDNIIPVTEIAIFKAVESHSKQFGIKLGNHSLRKWCTSYWDRKGDKAMVNFVLRHSAIKLIDRYIAPLTPDEAMERQNAFNEDIVINPERVIIPSDNILN